MKKAIIFLILLLLAWLIIPTTVEEYAAKIFHGAVALYNQFIAPKQDPFELDTANERILIVSKSPRDYWEEGDYFGAIQSILGEEDPKNQLYGQGVKLVVWETDPVGNRGYLIERPFIESGTDFLYSLLQVAKNGWDALLTATQVKDAIVVERGDIVFLNATPIIFQEFGANYIKVADITGFHGKISMELRYNIRYSDGVEPKFVPLPKELLVYSPKRVLLDGE